MPKREPSAYNKFVKLKMAELKGTPTERMKQIGILWKKEKEPKKIDVAPAKISKKKKIVS